MSDARITLRGHTVDLRNDAPSRRDVRLSANLTDAIEEAAAFVRSAATPEHIAVAVVDERDGTRLALVARCQHNRQRYKDRSGECSDVSIEVPDEAGYERWAAHAHGQRCESCMEPRCEDHGSDNDSYGDDGSGRFTQDIGAWLCFPCIEARHESPDVY